MRWLIIASLALSVACENSDVGDPCPDLEVPDPVCQPDGGVDRCETSEIVQFNTAFPCESTVCVATTGTTGGYCSEQCRDDAGCPDGFECRTVMELGQFADQTFCAWKTCITDAECGGGVCEVAQELSFGGDNVKICGLKDE